MALFARVFLLLFISLQAMAADAPSPGTSPDAAPADARASGADMAIAPGQVKGWARYHLDKRMKLQILSLGTKAKPFVLLVAYQPLPDWDPDIVVPEDVRGGARLFVFVSAEPVEIRNHGLLSPDSNGGRERPYINCDEAKVYYLSDQHEPTVVAQSCGELNEYVTRYLIFAAGSPEGPTLGKVTSSPGVAIGPQERFVPGSLPWASEPSPYRGDGKTLVEGVEIQGQGDEARTRSYRIEWNGHGLQRVSAPWRPVR
jgi:hypothetical protein